MVRSIVAALIFMCVTLSAATANQNEPDFRMQMKVAPKERLSSKWAFVIDTSHSITNFNLFDGILSGFTEATSYPSDDLKFCMYAFNDRSCWDYREWALMPAHKDQNGNVTKEWKTAIDWLYEHTGTMSYGGGAIDAALRKKVKELTVIIISDGGFTEEGEAIFKIIKDAQAWRVAEGYGEAVIVTIGIENMACRPRYPKPTNATCQSWMIEIGDTGKGGYFYVYKSSPRGNK